MKKMGNLSILLICVLTVLLSACSYREFEDSLKSKLNNGGEGEYYENTASIPDDSLETDDEGVFSVGDTITHTDAGNETVQYTLNQVHVSDNIHDIGLSVDDFDDTSLMADNGDIDEEYRLVTVDVSVKNIDYVGFDLDRDDPTLFIESRVGFKDDIEDPDGPWLAEASYFSEHPPLDQNQGNNYYTFSLAVGDEMEATVGWFLPADRLEEEPLYYVIGSAGRSEDYRYFKLDFDEGENDDE